MSPTIMMPFTCKSESVRIDFLEIAGALAAAQGRQADLRHHLKELVREIIDAGADARWPYVFRRRMLHENLKLLVGFLEAGAANHVPKLVNTIINVARSGQLQNCKACEKWII